MLKNWYKLSRPIAFPFLKIVIFMIRLQGQRKKSDTLRSIGDNSLKWIWWYRTDRTQRYIEHREIEIS